MKINPIGIQSYQSVRQREQQTAVLLEQRAANFVGKTEVLTPQAKGQASQIAHKAPAGSYANMLSVAERAALEMLFSKFKPEARLGNANGSTDSVPADSKQPIGRLVDVKV
ncbi:MAG: hypothetical protein SGI97_03195 [candidate division Zixibacteria bacterium]|nr:hypothetical protein [candidate division Zixibacteria bacterium]